MSKKIMELIIDFDAKLSEHERISAQMDFEKQFYLQTGKRFNKIRAYNNRGVSGIVAFCEGYDLSQIEMDTWNKYLSGDFAEPQASIDARENDRKGNHR